ncbi:hypothetical protein HYC85_031288 [Camellia sinensis]|uniref:40S ribosomal protein S15 n=1 Tax=Camellia sinensis TaxID=4442 RepID=A0A7J7FQD4_CAMSI|nr:hypothetical protein HYC85_031288 [Camellia sinensis]
MEIAAGQPKKRTFKKFSFRGVDLDALLDMSTDELVKLFTARARRRFQRGLKRKPMALIKKLRKAICEQHYRAVHSPSQIGVFCDGSNASQKIGHLVENEDF